MLDQRTMPDEGSDRGLIIKLGDGDGKKKMQVYLFYISACYWVNSLRSLVWPFESFSLNPQVFVTEKNSVKKKSVFPLSRKDTFPHKAI